MTGKKPSGAKANVGKVEITSRDRVIYPDSGQTKGALADYYEAVAPILLPFAVRRPVSLVRCPQGRAKDCFYQKHDTGGFGDAVKTVPIREKDGSLDDYLYVEDAHGLLQCVQMGTIEFHGWGACCDDVEAPDRMVFDLDPDEGMEFGAVKEAARDIRDRLSDLGLASFAMLTGGKGVHVVVPLTRGHDWDAHRDFAKGLAESLAGEDPGRFTASMSKAKRKGRIFVDWLRNQRGNTAILPYSARARKGAPVAAPVAWDELPSIAAANAFTIDESDNLISRSATKALSAWGQADQALPSG